MEFIFSTAYLAPVSYYTHLYTSSHSVIEHNCHYVKQTYRNRCHIVGSNGVMPLSIPVEKPSGGKCKTKDIRISDHDNWQHLHWNAIASAYGSTPFFEYYQDDLLPFYKKKLGGTFLVDFNEELRATLCALLDIEPNVSFSSHYMPTNELADLRDKIHPKKDISEALPNYRIIPYYQVFDRKFGFTPELSIIDLLFNMGPESLLILSGKK